MRKLFLLLTLTFTSYSLFAQEDSISIPYDELKVLDYSNPKEYIIQDITVSGVKHIQKEVLVSLSGLKKGNTIVLPGDDITRVLNKFWEQGLFSDIKISATKIEGNKVWLDLFLLEQPRILTIELNGVNKSETQDILEKINLRNGQQITVDIVDNTRRIIVDHFIDKGFLNTDVVIRQEMDSVGANVNMAALIIDIEKNDRIKIDEIYFIGNEVFTDQRLKRVMKNTKKVNLNIFKSSKVISEKIKEDKESLITFYNENGYRDAKVLGDTMVLSTEKENRVDLYIEIEEGNKYYFGDIEWIGNTKYSSELLSFVLGIEKGDVFDQSILDKRLTYDEDAVNSVYLNNGYLFFELHPIEVSVENDTINFEMRIREGDQATVDQVIITGNTKTNEHVARRELYTKPGDLFSKQAIIRSVRELSSLGHFDPEQIVPNPIPNAQDGTVDIEYQLTERANDQLEVSGGYGAGMLIFTAGVRFSNFAMRNFFESGAWRPVPSGDGQTLSIRAQTNGKYYQSYNFSFIEPWLGGKKPNSLSVSVFHSKMNKDMYSYWRTADSEVSDQFMKITGASVGLGRRLNWPDDFFILQHSLSYQRYLLNDFSDYFLTDNGTFNNFSFTSTLGRNSTDQPIYPRRGSDISLSLQLTPPYSKFNNTIDYANAIDEVKYKWVEYHRWMFKADWYKALTADEKLVFYTRMHFGYLGMYNKDIGPSPFESFDLGGDGLTGYNLYGRETIALRGYENGSLTPRLSYTTNEVIPGTQGRKSGNVYTKFTMELRYPISLNPSATVFALLFAEGGDAWYSIEDFNPFQAKRSLGIGLRAFLPMFGLLGIDWGYGFDEPWENAGVSGSQFHFTIGQQF